MREETGGFELGERERGFGLLSWAQTQYASQIEVGEHEEAEQRSRVGGVVNLMVDGHEIFACVHGTVSTGAGETVSASDVPV